jgi:hypothetical protein
MYVEVEQNPTPQCLYIRLRPNENYGRTRSACSARRRARFAPVPLACLATSAIRHILCTAIVLREADHNIRRGTLSAQAAAAWLALLHFGFLKPPFGRSPLPGFSLPP